MSGFVSELMVFAGFPTDEAYSLTFRIVIDGLAAVGVILTPIYLLSMLREIFFSKENRQLVTNTNLVDAEPHEIYIICCLLVPIIGIGLYPRLMTDSYRSSIDALVDRDVVAMGLAQTTHGENESQPLTVAGSVAGAGTRRKLSDTIG
jgi:NADH:ubiquinone oxidoreductase subunit 4 (chain M)